MSAHESIEDRRRWNREAQARRTARSQWMQQLATGLGIDAERLINIDPVKLGIEARDLI